MIDPAILVAGAMYLALVVYALTGGADFGGGIWSLVARLRGEWNTARLAERAIAPIWEANHVWLIVAIVLMFVCFAPVFAFLTTVFHIPLTLALVGIVLRGSSYAFSAYGLGEPNETARWQRIFGVASVITPFVLGMVVGALATSDLNSAHQAATFSATYLQPWLQLFPIVCGLFSVALFAHLAAVYLTVEAKTESDREMYRLYGMFSGVGLGVAAMITFIAMQGEATGRALAAGLFGAWWGVPLHAATALLALFVLQSLYVRRFRRARVAVVVQTVLIFAGWAAAQYPYLIPDIYTIKNAASEVTVLWTTLGVLALGSVVLLPALLYLFAVFKSDTASDA